jgi:hypothetical protein
MWVFLSRRLRRWLIMAVAVPVIGGLARWLSQRLEEKHAGPTRASKALGTVGRVAQSSRQKQRQRSR